MIIKLDDFQKECFATIYASHEKGNRATLNASDTGTGKNIISLMLAQVRQKPFAIVCPANAVATWELQCQQFNAHPEFIYSFERLRYGKHSILNKVPTKSQKYGGYNWSWNVDQSVTLIADEIHECAGEKSQLSRLIKAAYDNKYIDLVTLSATVATSPLKMKAIGYILGLHNYGNWWQWCLHNGCTPGFFGGLEFNGKEGTPGHEALKRINKQIFPERGYRIEKAKLPPGTFPDNQIIPEMIDLPTTFPDQVKAALKDVVKLVEADQQKADDKEQAVSAFTVNTRDRLTAELKKIPYLLWRAEQSKLEGHACIIFCTFTRTREILQELLQAPGIYGGQNSKERKKVEADFQNNLTDALVVNIFAGGASIDLHDVLGGKPRDSILCPTYNAIKMLQALGRPHRRGGKTPVVQRVVFARNCVEEEIYHNVTRKINCLETLNDGELDL